MERMLIVHWNKSTGPDIIIQYPPQEEIPPKELFLRIWAIHELEKDNSIIEFCPKQEGKKYFSIIQKYKEEIYFVILVYEQNQKFEKIINDYPDILAIISKNLIELVHTDTLTRVIAESFNIILNLDGMERDDILINFFRDKIKLTILKILRSGITSKKRLIETLKGEYGFSTFNLDLLLIPFIRENLIEKKKLPGIGDCFFLINDLTFLKVPPSHFTPTMENELKRNDLYNKYCNDLIQIYFSSDSIKNIENKIIFNYLIDKNIYNLIKTLRKRTISVEECINMLGNRNELFEELLEEKIIFEAGGKIFLLSDLKFIKFTPFYIINHLKKRMEEKTVSFDELIYYLEILGKKIQTEFKRNFNIVL